jgi:hypothetical protein
MVWQVVLGNKVDVEESKRVVSNNPLSTSF